MVHNTIQRSEGPSARDQGWENQRLGRRRDHHNRIRAMAGRRSRQSSATRSKSPLQATELCISPTLQQPDPEDRSSRKHDQSGCRKRSGRRFRQRRPGNIGVGDASPVGRGWTRRATCTSAKRASSGRSAQRRHRPLTPATAKPASQATAGPLCPASITAVDGWRWIRNNLYLADNGNRRIRLVAARDRPGDNLVGHLLSFNLTAPARPPHADVCGDQRRRRPR